MGSDADSLVFSKSLSLIEKTKKRVCQVDGGEFPTASSEDARSLVLETLVALGEKAFWPAMSPESLYSSLIHIQALVDQLEESNSAHISWPLVSYCDEVWRQFFPKGQAKIFYSVMTEHNYGIGSFSSRLRRLAETILPPAEIHRIFNGVDLYCLQLASLEDENLPLYANIGHEFGHAFYWSRQPLILKALSKECDAVYKLIVDDLNRQDPAMLLKRRTKTAWILKGIATELFCDLIGFLISGPAFFFSLHEMGWGPDQSNWRAVLSPTSSNVRAYPSFRFRLHCLRKWPTLLSFEAEAKKAFPGLSTLKLREMATYLSTISSDHSHDRVEISAFSDPDNDRSAIQNSFAKYLTDLKTSLENFVGRCLNEFIPSELKPDAFPPPSAVEVFQLLRRLENDILPNIIPDDSLLGVPASFSAILNASAIYRIHILSTRDGALGPDAIYRAVQKVERLTAKALEVSYIQREFKNWKGHPAA